MNLRFLMFPAFAWVLGMASAPSAAVAQTAVLSDISEKIREADAVINIAPQAVALYSPLPEKPPYAAA